MPKYHENRQKIAGGKKRKKATDCGENADFIKELLEKYVFHQNLLHCNFQENVLLFSKFYLNFFMLIKDFSLILVNNFFLIYSKLKNIYTYIIIAITILGLKFVPIIT